MSAQAIKKPSVDHTRIGDYAASQPLSGIEFVGLMSSVSGISNDSFIRGQATEKLARKSS